MVPIAAFAAAVPLLLRLLPRVIPPAYFEPYTYWSPAALNDHAADDGRLPGWRNMGWWEETDSFTDANEALARRLLAFADVNASSVLDLAHGTGESLLLHLESRPAHLHALTSLPAESAAARALVDAAGAGDTALEYFASSAALRPATDLAHPLNPMRGLMGERGGRGELDEDEDEDGDGDAAGGAQAAFAADSPDAGGEAGTDAPPPYDLVYILDAIYHFPPSRPDFLSAALRVLRPDSGVLAYTDLVPPADLAPWLAFALPRLLGVPARNLQQRAPSLDAYAAMLENVGYDRVRVEDWTAGVLPGLARHLAAKGGVWAWVAKAVERAEKDGWKFVAVRAQRPAARA